MLQQPAKFINLSIFNLIRAFLLFLLLIFTLSIFLHTDSAITQDLGRHLTLGKIIWETKQIPQTNLFSYTYPDFPFINHHWGSEVIFYLIYKAFAIDGLILLKVVVLTAAFGILIICAFGHSNMVGLLLTGILALGVLHDRTEVRPEMFAYLLFSISLIIFYRERKKQTKMIWVLPLLQLFWVNLHISFIFGLGLYFFFFLDRLILKKVKKEYYILGLSLIAATFFNPFGWRLVVYPMRIFQNYGYSIVENQSLFFLEPIMKNSAFINFKIAAVLFLIVSPLLFRRKYYFETAAVLFFGFLSFNAIRHFPFFIFSLIYPLSFGLTQLWQKIADSYFLKKVIFSNIQILAVIAMCGFITLKIFSLLTNRYYVDFNSPVRTGLGQVTGFKNAVDFFQNHNLRGPIFNSFDNGSYLIYRLYPKERVFVDGRPEAYPADFFLKIYILTQENENVWKEIEKQYKFRTIIFPHTDITPWGRQFLKKIVNNQSWKLVFFDDYTVVLVQKEVTLKDILSYDDRDKISQKGMELIKEAKEPDQLARLSNFFNVIDLTDLATMAEVKKKLLMSQRFKF